MTITLDTKLEALGLSPVTLACLVSEGVSYAGELVQYGEMDLLVLRGFGRKNLRDVRETLARHALSASETWRPADGAAPVVPIRSGGLPIAAWRARLGDDWERDAKTTRARLEELVAALRSGITAAAAEGQKIVPKLGRPADKAAIKAVVGKGATALPRAHAVLLELHDGLSMAGATLFGVKDLGPGGKAESLAKRWAKELPADERPANTRIVGSADEGYLAYGDIDGERALIAWTHHDGADRREASIAHFLVSVLERIDGRIAEARRAQRRATK